MQNWLSAVAALVGGGLAAGAAFYVVGRRVERRAAAAAARAAAGESERLLEDARQRIVLAAKAELLQVREDERSPPRPGVQEGSLVGGGKTPERQVVAVES